MAGVPGDALSPLAGSRDEEVSPFGSTFPVALARLMPSLPDGIGSAAIGGCRTEEDPGTPLACAEDSARTESAAEESLELDSSSEVSIGSAESRMLRG